MQGVHLIHALLRDTCELLHYLRNILDGKDRGGEAQVRLLVGEAGLGRYGGLVVSW